MNMAICRTVSYIGLPAELTLLHRLKGLHGLRCLKYKIAKLWNEMDTELQEETSPTQFKSLLKLILLTKLYSDY